MLSPILSSLSPFPVMTSLSPSHPLHSSLHSVFLVYILCSLVPSPAADDIIYTHIASHTTPDQVDMWTKARSGCACPYNILDHSCACCMAEGGCHCGRASPQRCAQCGLEHQCNRMCNVTIRAEDVKSRSGKYYGEIKSDVDMKGPTFCWFRLIPLPGQRVEIHLYRIMRMGHYDQQQKRCVGGGIQFVSSEEVSFQPSELVICGENERYSPPVVMFRDPEGGGSAVLLVSVTSPTPRSQFLAHYSFTPDSRPSTGLQIKGGKRDRNSVCDWEFPEHRCPKKKSCQISSPGYPGIYPQNIQCRYFIKMESVTKRIKITFTNFNLPTASNCSSSGHRVSIFSGVSSSDPLLKTLCGYIQKDLVIETQSSVMIQFSSGLLSIPFNYNGFIAKIEFVNKSKESKRKSGGKHHNKQKKVSARLRKSQQKIANQMGNKKMSGGGVSKCQDEFDGEIETARTGLISSSSLFLHDNTCSIVFKGASHDVLILNINSYTLSGPKCQSSLRLSVRDRTSSTGTRLVKQLCSPLSSSDSLASPLYSGNDVIVVVNSSLVFLDFKTMDQHSDSFTGAFSFHNARMFGFPDANSLCNIEIRGDAFPYLPQIRGVLSTPGFSSLFSWLKGPLHCKTILTPGIGQTSQITITRSSPGLGPSCRTQCGLNGCRCLSANNAADLDLLTVTSSQGHLLSCFCGNFQDVLPVTLTSTLGLVLSYRISRFSFSTPEDNQRFKFNAGYEFLKKDSCGPTNWKTIKGEISGSGLRNLSMSSARNYFHDVCQWIIDPPPRRNLKLVVNINQLSKTNVSCSDWNATIWTMTKIAPIKRTSVDTLCPGGVAREYNIQKIYERKLYIRISSMMTRRVPFLISWETKEPMPLHALGTEPQGVTKPKEEFVPVSDSSSHIPSPSFSSLELLILSHFALGHSFLLRKTWI